MKIGWVRDFSPSERPGGAQVCGKLLQGQTPPDVELIECPPGSVRDDVDAYIAMRCQRYSLEEINQVVSKPCLHWAMDYWEWDNFPQREVIFTKSTKIIFGSPLHKSVFVGRWGLGQKADLLAYPMDVEHWLSVRSMSNGREGAMWYGEVHPIKGVDLLVSWANSNRAHLDMYGIGHGEKQESQFVKIWGLVSDTERDQALASHQHFIHFPRGPEGFCYSLMEAWLAGLQVVYSGRIGLDSWDKPWADLAVDCYHAPERFWKIAEQCL